MQKIQVLDKQLSELIAAGEVVERPASVVKELIENSIDAGASEIAIEIKRGGILRIKITDNGCGIARDDVATAFLRHATSKIKNTGDLDAIATLGFRGEALAAISAVSKIQIITRTTGEAEGTYYVCEGGNHLLTESIGCAVGTTIFVEDLFYNTPARMKFLKKDVSEGNAAAAVVEKIALSHPEISFKFIRDEKTILTTPGDNKLSSAIYTILGREFAATLLPVDREQNGVQVQGYVTKPNACRGGRTMQFFFINERLIKSPALMAAVEQAYKNMAMVGRFPGCVLHISIPFGTVDVNVHPAKTEVRFSDDKRVFDAVYYAVKTALTTSQIPVKSAPASMPTVPEEVVAQTVIREFWQTTKPKEPETVAFSNNNLNLYGDEKAPAKIKLPTIDIEKETKQKSALEPKPAPVLIKEEMTTPFRVIGELFSTYVIVEQGEELLLLDIHAAHEHIIFNELQKTQSVEKQLLLTPVSVKLSPDEYTAVMENLDLLEEAGYEVEDFDGSVLVRGVPIYLANESVSALISEAADGFIKHKKDAKLKKTEWLYTSVACRAAIKAGANLSLAELTALCEKVFFDSEVSCCPHGRPVTIKYTKKQLEKQFGRIQ